jgi:hypothetical protein
MLLHQLQQHTQHKHVHKPGHKAFTVDCGAQIGSVCCKLLALDSLENIKQWRREATGRHCMPETCCYTTYNSICSVKPMWLNQVAKRWEVIVVHTSGQMTHSAATVSLITYSATTKGTQCKFMHVPKMSLHQLRPNICSIKM